MATIRRIPLTDLVDDVAVKAKLAEPVGSPLNLTREQALAIIHAGIGGRPDLPLGDEYVRRMRHIWKGLKPLA